MTRLRDVAPRLRMGQGISRHNLTIFPLFAEDTVVTAEYVPLGTAIRTGAAKVTEVSEGGSVPTLALDNSGTIPVLIIDGEELIGAKQNRIVNLSILAPAKQKLSIPVSCVEQGRWSHRSREFSESPDVMFSSGRARKSRDVNASLSQRGLRVADQGAVWDDVAAFSADLAYNSPTGAMRDVSESRRSSLEEYVKDVDVADGQVGAVFAINGDAVGVELFDSPETFRTYLPKVLRSYALDAIRGAIMDPVAAEDAEAEQLLESILELEAHSFPALGLGEDLRIESPQFSGGALSHEGRVVHLAAFNTAPLNSGNGSRGTNGRSSTGATSQGTGPASLASFRLDIRRGHMLFEIGGRYALLDTGSPLTIGRGRPLVIAGRTFSPSNAMESVLDTVSSHINRPVEWLLGYDFFAANRVMIDWPNRSLGILDRGAQLPVGHSIPIELVLGVPFVAGRSGEASVRAVLDTGASLSYVPDSVVAGLEPVSTRQDFFPTFGEFETSVWRVRAQIAGRRLVLKVGVLPDTLLTLLGAVVGRETWIIGSDFFRGRQMVIDYAAGRVVDVTVR